MLGQQTPITQGSCQNQIARHKLLVRRDLRFHTHLWHENVRKQCRLNDDAENHSEHAWFACLCWQSMRRCFTKPADRPTQDRFQGG